MTVGVKRVPLVLAGLFLWAVLFALGVATVAYGLWLTWVVVSYR